MSELLRKIAEKTSPSIRYSSKTGMKVNVVGEFARMDILSI
jgi:hypothetical protein